MAAQGFPGHETLHGIAQMVDLLRVNGPDLG